MNKKYGFTIAELLITLGIIGVIAALTIPALTKKNETNEIKIRWKKYFAEFSQIETRIRTEKNSLWSGTGICNYWTTYNNCVYQEFKPYLNAVKYCDTDAIAEGCFVSGDEIYRDNNVVCGTGGCLMLDTSGARGAILQSGAGVMFTRLFTDCPNSSTDWRYGCGRIYIDLNNIKPPNKLGTDIFIMLLMESKLVPWKGPYDSNKSFDYLYN